MLGIEIQFSNKNKIEQELKQFLTELSNNNKLKIQIDNTAIMDLKRQMTTLQESLKQSFNNININTGIQNAVAGLKQELNGLEKTQVKFVDGEQVQLIEQVRKNLLEVEKTIYNFKNNKITEISSTDYANAQKTLYSQLEKYQKQQFDLQQKMVGADTEKNAELQKQISIIDNLVIKNRELIRLYGLTDDDRDISLLNQKNLLQSQLNIKVSEQQKVERENTIELQKQINLFRMKQENEIGKLQSRYKDLLNTKDITAYKQELDALNINTPDVTNKMKEMGIQLQGIGVNAQNSRKSLDMANKSSMSLGETISLTVKKFAEWYVIGNLFMSIPHFIGNATTYINQMDTSLVNLSKVVNITKDQMNDMKISAVDMAKELGKSSIDIASGFAEWGRITKNINEIKELTRVSTMTSNVTDLSVAEASKSLIATIAQFKLQNKDAMSVLDSWNELQNNFKVTATSIAQGIEEVGTVAQQSGTKLQELESYLTALSVAGIEGAEGGTAIKSMISRVYRLGSEGEDDAGKAEQALKRIGVAVRDESNNFRTFSAIISDTQKAWSNLSNVQKMALSQAIGGTHHYGKFQILMESQKTIMDALNVSYNSQNSAIKENEKYLDSLEGRVQIFKTTLQETYATLLQTDEVKSLVTTGTELLNVINSITKSIGLIPTSIATITTGFALFKKEWSAINLTANYKNGVFTGMDIGGFLGNSFKKVQTDIKSFSAEWAKLNTQSMYVNGQFAGIPSTLTRVGNGFKALTQSTVAQTVATAALRVGTIALNTVIGLGIGFLISAGISAISKYVEKKKELQKIDSEYIKTNQEEVLEAKNLINERETLLKQDNLTTDQKQRLYDINEKLVQLFPDLNLYYNEETKQLSAQKEVLEGLNAEKEKILLAKANIGYESIKDSIESIINQYKSVGEEIDDFNERIKNGQQIVGNNPDNNQWGALTTKQATEYINKLTAKYEELGKKIDDYNANIEVKNKIEGTNIPLIEKGTTATDKETDAIVNNTDVKNDNINVTDGLTESNEDFTKTMDDLNKSFDESTQKIDDYNTFIKELSKNDKLSVESTEKIRNSYSDLIPYLGDAKTMHEKVADALGIEQTAQGDLATAIAKAAIMREEIEIGTTKMTLEQASIRVEALKSERDAYFKAAMSGQPTGTPRGWTDEQMQMINAVDDAKARIEKLKGEIVKSGNAGLALKNDKKSSKSTVDDLQLEIDRYQKLNNVLKDYETQLQSLNSLEQNSTSNTEKINLMNKEIALLEKKRTATMNLLNEERKEREELKSTIKSQGFTIDSAGEVANYETRLKALLDAANKKSGDAKKAAQESVQSVQKAIERYVQLVHTEIPATARDWEELGYSIRQVGTDIQSLTAESFSLVESLQADIISALRSQYEQSQETELSAIESRYNAILPEYESRVEALRAELEALQDDMQEDINNLAGLEQDQADWARDDSVYSKGKQVDLAKQIAAKRKDIAIKQKQDEIEQAEKALEAQQKLKDEEIKLAQEKYAQMLDEKNLYDEANKLLTSKNMDEIIKLLETYDSKYKNIGQKWGKSLVDELTKTVKEGMSALDFLNTNASTSNGTSGTGGSTTTPSGTSTGKSNYGLGDSGDAITKIQQALQLLVNNHLVQSGTYDSATASAVSLFQGQQGLYRSGLVDEETLKKLNELMNGRITIPHFLTGGMVKGSGLVFADDKEIILNKNDSGNILKSVNILKTLVHNFPKLDFGKLSNQRPQNNYNSPLVVNEITQNNNTPFDVANSNDNLARLMKKQLNFIGGTV